MENMPVVNLGHARKAFGSNEVLKDISLTVNQGDVLSIIGPSGGGKSTLLRCMTLLETLDEFSDGMCRASAQLIRYRAAFSARLDQAAAPIHKDFSNSLEELEIKYKTVSTVKDPFASAREIYYDICEHQEKHRQAELESAQCLTGAHKDDLEIFINGTAARSFASQGQTRTAALSIKLAEREIFLAETGEYPVLLLDDVLSELDTKRQEFVLNRIGGGQTLISCCEDEGISKRTGGRVLFISEGTIK